jgi:hypothetical protein
MLAVCGLGALPLQLHYRHAHHVICHLVGFLLQGITRVTDRDLPMRAGSLPHVAHWRIATMALQVARDTSAMPCRR